MIGDLKPMVDVHGHIQFPAYDADRTEVIGRARKAGVKMIAVGTQAESSALAIKCGHDYPESVWATVGFHPSHAGGDTHHDKNEQHFKETEPFDFEKYKKMAMDAKVVAISECGFDYFRLDGTVEADVKKIQRDVFAGQLRLADEVNKPIMMHVRPSRGSQDAYEDALALIDGADPKADKIMHFYAGSLDVTRKFLERGFYFTFGGVITFSRDYDELIRFIPLDRIMLETDCPYVSPKSVRGKRNEPAFVREVGEILAAVKNTGLDEVLDQVYRTSIGIFRLK